MTKLSRSFYINTNTLFLAEELIGSVLCTRINGQFTSGIISETEAYLGAEDRASHAFGNKLTERTSSMFLEGGHAYVYLCYGLHYLFNVVTGTIGNPQAVLIRNIIPLEGIELMKLRRGKLKKLMGGPAIISNSLGINLGHDKINLGGDTIWIETGEFDKEKYEIIRTARIGVQYSGSDALLPYRFLLQACRESE